MDNFAIKIPLSELEVFCQKWQVKALSLFGSVLRDDFNHSESDIDILIEFMPAASWGFEISLIKQELEEIFNRPVDLVSKKSIERSRNPYRKTEILSSSKLIYEQAA